MTFFCEYNNISKPYVYIGAKTLNTAFYFRFKDPSWLDTPHEHFFL